MSNQEANLPRDFKGIWIPRELWVRNDLSFFEKCLAAEIDSLDNDEGCNASNEYFMRFFQLKERALQNGFAKLKKLNLMQIIRFDGRITWRRGYSKITNAPLPCKDNAPQGCRKMHPYTAEKCTPPLKDIHIYKNKVKNKEEKSRNSVAPSEKSFGLASLLFSKIKEIDPKAKTPKLETWANEIEKMQNIDKRDTNEIENLINFIFKADSWWKGKILSPKKLREKATTLIAAMKNNANCGRTGQNIDEQHKTQYEGHF